MEGLSGGDGAAAQPPAPTSPGDGLVDYTQDELPAELSEGTRQRQGRQPGVSHASDGGAGAPELDTVGGGHGHGQLPTPPRTTASSRVEPLTEPTPEAVEEPPAAATELALDPALLEAAAAGPGTGGSNHAPADASSADASAAAATATAAMRQPAAAVEASSPVMDVIHDNGRISGSGGLPPAPAGAAGVAPEQVHGFSNPSAGLTPSPPQHPPGRLSPHGSVGRSGGGDGGGGGGGGGGAGGGGDEERGGDLSQMDGMSVSSGGDAAGAYSRSHLSST